MPPNLVLFPRRVSSTILSLLIISPAMAGEPPTIDRLIPAGGQRGTSVETNFTGKPGDGDLRIISDNDAIAFTLNENRDAATVTISETARPGVHWLRFCNADGATELKPFIVGMIPEVVESEPNAKTAESKAMNLPSVTVNGVLGKSGDVDTFAVDLTKGQTLVASMQANAVLGSPMDGVLQILDAHGTIVAQNDDDIDLDPRIAYMAPEDGTWYVRTFAFPAAPDSTIGFAGGADYVYRLTLTTAPVIEHTEPVVRPESESETAMTIFGWNISRPEVSMPINQNVFTEPYTLAFPVPTCNIPSINESKLADDRSLPIPVAVTGRIMSSDASTFPFHATKGQKLSISVQARQFGSLLDPVLAVEDSTGTLSKESDDISGDNHDVEIHVTIPSDGQYLTRVSDRFQNSGLRYFYVLRCEETIASFEPTLASTVGILKADKPLEIPILFERRHGFAEAIEIKVEGLPDGVTFECPRSEKDGETSKKVTLTINGTTSESFQGPIQIVAESIETKQSKAVVFFAADNTQFSEYWLTIPK